MKNLKFKFSYESTGNELTQLCRDKQIRILPKENCTGRDIVEILCPMINQFIEVGMESVGNVVIEDDIIYIEYEVTNEEHLITELKEVYMFSELDFTRGIDVFGPKDYKGFKFEFEYKSLGDNLTNLITDKDIHIDLCTNCSWEYGLIVIGSLIKNQLIDIGIESKGIVEIEDDIIYIQYSTTQTTGNFNDKKVYPISVLNFSVEEDDEF